MIYIQFIIHYLIRCEPLNHEDINLHGKIKATQVYSYKKGHKSVTSISPVVNQATTCKEGFMFDHQSLDCIGIKILKFYLFILILLTIVYFFNMNFFHWNNLYFIR